ncbi:MAG TPA: hypothetical protein VKX49_20640 [Bryobacteraceae bacterium]|nr:hypothetical protein [Bryobacteraceae bacterium]
MILVNALAGGALYCGLLPLWEGFDELYHYGYVQYISTRAAFPVAGRTALSRELWSSVEYTPLSTYIQPFVYRPSTSFQQYFALSNAERVSRRHALDGIPREFQRESSPRENYEAKHAPLTYLVLAPLDRWLSSEPLTSRVLILRLVLSFTSILLLWIGANALARAMHLSSAMQSAALFVLFCCQMIYAVSSHIGNDALLLPWFVVFVLAIIRACESPSGARIALSAVAMAVGLLIKAFALLLLPLLFVAPLIACSRNIRFGARLVAIACGIPLALAGPWYIRNLVLYRSLTASYDSIAAVSFGEIFTAALEVPWPKSLADMAHNALWTGNNMFTSFSAVTLDVLIVLLLLAFVLFALRFRRTIAEIVLLSAIGLYAAGLAAATAGFFVSSKGQVAVAAPWYLPVLFAPSLMLCFAGLDRWRPAGTWLAVVNVVLWAYVAVASWIAKLIPQYGGFPDPHAHLLQLWNWYWHQAPLRYSILRTLCPAPPAAIWSFLALVLATLLPTCMLVLLGLVRERRLALHKIP